MNEISNAPFTAPVRVEELEMRDTSSRPEIRQGCAEYRCNMHTCSMLILQSRAAFASFADIMDANWYAEESRERDAVS